MSYEFEVVIPIQPKSNQSKGRKKATYQNELQQIVWDHFCRLYPNETELPYDQLDKTGLQIIGIVYYFPPDYQQQLQTDQLQDADNISKPIWDALQGKLYQDDHVVNIRIAGVIDLTDELFDENITISNQAAAEIQNYVAREQPALYVRIQTITNHSIPFTL